MYKLRGFLILVCLIHITTGLNPDDYYRNRYTYLNYLKKQKFSYSGVRPSFYGARDLIANPPAPNGYNPNVQVFKNM